MTLIAPTTLRSFRFSRTDIFSALYLLPLSDQNQD